MDTTEFIESVKRAITVPTYQPRFTPDDLLTLAAEEQRTTVVPKLISLRQSFLLWRTTEAVVADQATVSFPARAVARGSKQIRWMNAGAATYEESELVEYTLREQQRFRQAGVPQGFFEYGDKIGLLPPPEAAGTVVFYAFLKPAKPVRTTRASQVVSIGTDSLTVASLPANVTVGSLVDVTKGTPGFTPQILDNVVTNISGNTVTLTGYDVSTPITGISVGDWVSTAGETAVIQLPDEMTDVLIYCTAIRVLMAMQMPEQLDLVRKEFNMKLANAEMILAPRVEDNVAVLFNGHPLLGTWGNRGIPRVTVTDQ